MLLSSGTLSYGTRSSDGAPPLCMHLTATPVRVSLSMRTLESCQSIALILTLTLTLTL